MDTSFSETVAADGYRSPISKLWPEAVLRPEAEPKTKAGLEGARLSSVVKVGLVSISATVEASGRSTGFSWTHSSPSSTQLKTSLSGYCLPSDGSTMSAVSPVVHFLHTCTES